MEITDAEHCDTRSWSYSSWCWQWCSVGKWFLLVTVLRNRKGFILLQYIVILWWHAPITMELKGCGHLLCKFKLNRACSQKAKPSFWHFHDLCSPQSQAHWRQNESLFGHRLILQRCLCLLMRMFVPIYRIYRATQRSIRLQDWDLLWAVILGIITMSPHHTILAVGIIWESTE